MLIWGEMERHVAVNARTIRGIHHEGGKENKTNEVRVLYKTQHNTMHIEQTNNTTRHATTHGIRCYSMSCGMAIIAACTATSS